MTETQRREFITPRPGAESCSRHFVNVEGRQVHYWRAGAGPVAVLRHESPRSSRSLLPLIVELARPQLTPEARLLVLTNRFENGFRQLAEVEGEQHLITGTSVAAHVDFPVET